MKYRAIPYVAHDELDEVLQEYKGWEIHSVLPVKHSQTTDHVTLIMKQEEDTGLSGVEKEYLAVFGPKGEECLHEEYIVTSVGWICRKCDAQISLDDIHRVGG